MLEQSIHHRGRLVSSHNVGWEIPRPLKKTTNNKHKIKEQDLISLKLFLNVSRVVHIPLRACLQVIITSAALLCFDKKTQKYCPIPIGQ